MLNIKRPVFWFFKTYFCFTYCAAHTTYSKRLSGVIGYRSLVFFFFFFFRSIGILF